jgi:hypothetical protein
MATNVSRNQAQKPTTTDTSTNAHSVCSSTRKPTPSNGSATKSRGVSAQCAAQMHEAAMPTRSRVFTFVVIEVLNDTLPNILVLATTTAVPDKNPFLPTGSQPDISASARLLQRRKFGARAKYLVRFTACENFSVNGLSRRISGRLPLWCGLRYYTTLWLCRAPDAKT